MARKKITSNLNGGDALTAMSALVFQVHDASDDSIIATANYASIGSVDVPGSDSANITYTLDTNYDPGSGLLGQIILDGVELGSVTDVKIRCKDASGNESVLSASKPVVENYKTVLNISEGQYISATGLTALSTGVIKYAFNMPTIPVTDSTKIITIGTLVCSYSASQLRIGSSAGLDLYPIAGVEGADVEITYLNTAPYTTTLEIDGVPITADTVSGTKAAVSGNAIQFPTVGADTVSYKHVRISEDGTEIVTYELNEGTGTNVADTSGNADDGTITVGTGNISTVWVGL